MQLVVNYFEWAETNAIKAGAESSFEVARIKIRSQGRESLRGMGLLFSRVYQLELFSAGNDSRLHG
ncbi:antirepressor [Citrobacter phage HCF1]|uniref:Antirepressor n=1 Tax=Citrobacter phage HCF1 TaxID=2849700 RepID=A0ABX6D474_9CAUD|nr:antirepressor [Citrobacter phage HCF1]